MRVPIDLTGEEALKKRADKERGNRDKFLIELYRKAEGDVGRAIPVEEFISKIGLNKYEASRAARYFTQHNLVKIRSPISAVNSADVVLDVSITAHGIDVVDKVADMLLIEAEETDKS